MIQKTYFLIILTAYFSFSIPAFSTTHSREGLQRCIGCAGCTVMILGLLSLIGYLKPTCQVPSCSSQDSLYCCNDGYNGSASELHLQCKSYLNFNSPTCNELTGTCINQTWTCVHSTVDSPVEYTLKTPDSKQQCDISGGCKAREASKWGLILTASMLGAVFFSSLLATCCQSKS